MWHVNASTEIQTETYGRLQFLVAYVLFINPEEKKLCQPLPPIIEIALTDILGRVFDKYG